MDAKTLRDTLAGAYLTALDEDSAECFSFHDDLEGAAATLGTRSGGVCAPILSCHVTDDAQVQFSGSTFTFSWDQIDLCDGVLTVRCGQRLKRFAYTPPKKRERYLP